MNHYQQLGVSRTASKNEIKKSYKKLALKHHPDKNQSNTEQAKQKFTKISQAYAVLSDPVKRQQYDESLLTKTNFGGEQYKWKNPEFDPSYNHFPKAQSAQGPKVDIGSFNMFEKFDMNFRFPLFKKNFMNVEFGGFTFEMAEEIFNQVFSQMQINPELEDFRNPMKSLANRESYYPGETIAKRYSDSYSYQPKNSSLISEKTIERNGKRVLVKKYSITQNGSTRTETHEQIIH